MNLEKLEAFANQFLARYDDEKHRYALAAIKGLCNGIVYGVKIRAPHALLMVILFGKGSFLEKLMFIVKTTAQHAFNLGRFVFGYKLIVGFLKQKVSMGYRHWHPFVAALIVAYFVFGKKNSINTQKGFFLFLLHLFGGLDYGSLRTIRRFYRNLYTIQ